jgi:predicted metal-dependent hydrolase
MTETLPEIEVRRSARRRRTVAARREGDRLIVMIPASMSQAEERRWVADMLARVERSEAKRRLSDDELMARARTLNDDFLDGRAIPVSVRWVTNQRSRWGSCTPIDGTIRISARVRPMPGWVLDYVLVHELAHLLEPSHNRRFWAWVDRYPQTERAKGFLEGYSSASDEPATEG